MIKNRIKLWWLKRHASPIAGFKCSLWQELEEKFNEASPAPSKWPRFILWRTLAMSTLVALVVVFVGTSAYAYTSPDVTEDTPLYALKLNLEKVESLTKVTPEAKAKFYLKTIERREAEKKVLEKRGKAIDKVETKIEKTEDQLQQVKAKLDQIKLRNPNLKLKVEKRLEERKQRLENRQTNLEKKQNDLEKKQIDAQNKKEIKEVKFDRLKENKRDRR